MSVRAEGVEGVGGAASLCGWQVAVEYSVATTVLSLKQEGPPSFGRALPHAMAIAFAGGVGAYNLWLLCVYHLTHLTTVFTINEV